MDAKYSAFNVLPFNKTCLAIKNYNESTYRTLVVDKRSSSLLSIFEGGQSQIGLSRETWLALRPGAYLQPNCNRNGFNMWNNRRNKISVRFGIIGNGKGNCWSPDSAIGIGIGSYERKFMKKHDNDSDFMAYLFVK